LPSAIRQTPDLILIFFPNILLDFGRSGIPTIATPLLASGNPIVLPSVPFKIVGFESAAGPGLKSSSPVIPRLADFEKSNPTCRLIR
jgi:hypothetical protein